ncbi:hypothetical protein OFM39_28845, partial [Escherichia coli]|nr:hypothetical protein [Escherichia coli]
RALVDMSLRRNAPGIRADARFTIRPRLAFEGNFYVDVDPGERGPLIGEGTTIPLRQTAGPVQIDQVVSELTTPVREGAKNAVGELGAALGA